MSAWGWMERFWVGAASCWIDSRREWAMKGLEVARLCLAIWARVTPGVRWLEEDC